MLQTIQNEPLAPYISSMDLGEIFPIISYDGFVDPALYLKTFGNIYK